MKPKLTPAHRLALLACLPAAAGASAGTVTLLSQERSVFARVDPGFNVPDRSDAPPAESATEAADGFGDFEAVLDLEILAEEISTDFARGTFARASQSSSFDEADGDVRLSVNGGAFAKDDGAGSTARFLYDVRFAVDGPTQYEFQGRATFFSTDDTEFRFDRADGTVARSPFEFERSGELDDSFSFDFMRVPTADNPSPPSATGTIEAGEYRLLLQATAESGRSGDPFVSINDFGLIFRDSTLAGGETDPPVAIPSPAALPAGLALLGAGLMRRRRDAAA